MKNLRYLIVCFTQCFLFFFFDTFGFLLPAFCFIVRYLWDVCYLDKCCVVTHRSADFRVAWLVFAFARIACLLQL